MKFIRLFSSEKQPFLLSCSKPTYQAGRFRQKIRGPVPKMRKLGQFVSLFRHGLSL